MGRFISMSENQKTPKEIGIEVGDKLVAASVPLVRDGIREEFSNGERVTLVITALAHFVSEVMLEAITGGLGSKADPRIIRQDVYAGVMMVFRDALKRYTKAAVLENNRAAVEKTIKRTIGKKKICRNG